MSGTNPHHYRGKVAALTRSRATDDPELIEARRDCRAAYLERDIRDALKGEPELLPEQRQRLAEILADGGAA